MLKKKMKEFALIESFRKMAVVDIKTIDSRLITICTRFKGNKEYLSLLAPT